MFNLTEPLNPKGTGPAISAGLFVSLLLAWQNEAGAEARRLNRRGAR